MLRALLLGAELNAEIDKALHSLQPQASGEPKKIGPALAMPRVSLDWPSRPTSCMRRGGDYRLSHAIAVTMLDHVIRLRLIRKGSNSARRLAAAGLLLLAAIGLRAFPLAQTSRPVVYVMPVHGMIDLGLAPFLTRTLREARDAGASAVVLDINTFGGRVDAAVAMRDALLNAPVPTIAFVNPRAISAGALIALATETIVIAGGGTIGAATPVVSGGGQPQVADEKSVSYVRKEFAATAERRGRPSAFAEAMVDADVRIAGVVESGKLLTLTSSEAVTHKVAEFSADTLEEALVAAGLDNADIRRTSQTWAESFVRFLTNPVVSSLLLTLGMLGLLVEIRTPGFALPGAVGIVSLALFFWGHWIVQLAGWEELLLVAAGLLLLGLELFVIPGFGVAGIAGIVALTAGLGLALVGAGATTSVIIAAFGRLAIAMLLALAGGLALLRLLPRLPVGRRLVLETEMGADQGYTSTPVTDRLQLGRIGTALSPLRPAGVADIGGLRVDVVSDGGFVDAGASIEVTRVEGNRVVVRQRSGHSEGSGTT
jgi:membrane-bound serine protease (ClpP class)